MLRLGTSIDVANLRGRQSPSSQARPAQNTSFSLPAPPIGRPWLAVEASEEVLHPAHPRGRTRRAFLHDRVPEVLDGYPDDRIPMVRPQE